MIFLINFILKGIYYIILDITGRELFKETLSHLPLQQLTEKQWPQMEQARFGSVS